MIFETHAHYDDEAFDGDRDELLKKMHDHGIGKIINVGASLKGVRDTAALTEKYSFVYGDTVRSGRFRGTETISYVSKVMEIYRAFCEICPEV